MINRLQRFLFLIIALLCVIPTRIPVYSADLSTYAQITTHGYLYSSPNTLSFYQICMLETTYFVKIILVNDNEFYYVDYCDVQGYVLKSVVRKIIGTPKNSFPNLTISTNDDKCFFRSSPKRADDNIIGTLQPFTSNIRYIGKIVGQEMWDFGGTTWYFVNYNGIKGYIYGGYLISRPSVPPNTEQIAFIESEQYLTVNPLSNQACLAIIFLTLIPAVFILIMLFKSPKVPVQKPAKVVHQTDNIDYDSLL